MRLPKINETRLGGNIAQVNIQNGQYGPYGSCSLAVDDSYFKKGQNGQQGEWIDRTYFVEVNLKSNVIKKVPNLSQGDAAVFKGKLVEEKWTDKNTGQQRSALKMEAADIEMHIEAHRAKQMRQEDRANNNQNNQQGNGGNNYQQNNGGGYQSNNNNQQNNQGGGYRSNNSNQQNNQGGGYGNNGGGGYQQTNQGGGYQHNGYEQHNGH